jgi:hypothetical protein
LEKGYLRELDEWRRSASRLPPPIGKIDDCCLQKSLRGLK